MTVYPCAVVRPDLVYHDYKLRAKCYEELPAKIDGSIYFANPLNREITSKGTTISCSETPHPNTKDHRAQELLEKSKFKPVFLTNEKRIIFDSRLIPHEWWRRSN